MAAMTQKRSGPSQVPSPGKMSASPTDQLDREPEFLGDKRPKEVGGGVGRLQTFWPECPTAAFAP